MHAHRYVHLAISLFCIILAAQKFAEMDFYLTINVMMEIYTMEMAAQKTVVSKTTMHATIILVEIQLQCVNF